MLGLGSKRVEIMNWKSKMEEERKRKKGREQIQGGLGNSDKVFIMWSIRYFPDSVKTFGKFQDDGIVNY